MLSDNDLTVFTADDVTSQLVGQEREIMDIIAATYRCHARGATICPHSLFLNLPQRGSRIIALPAHLGGESSATGVKWISSVPSNLGVGLPRASAVIVLNSAETGRAYALMEGSIISAKRTAASAAVAAEHLVAKPEDVRSLGV